MNKDCKQCWILFEITKDDLDFYGKVSPVFNWKKYQIPSPTFCSNCRQMRRASWRNERNLYKRKCDLNWKNIISIYSKDKPFKVYNQSDWWGDKWDWLDYWMEFDFNKTFFEQFRQLQLSVPRPALFNLNAENSEYWNHSVYNKNCYLCFNTWYSEDCSYLWWFVVKCKNCIDCHYIQQSELLYQCIDTKNSYNSKYLILCDNCKDSSYLFDCRNCNNCYLSSNLRNKEYYILNKQYSKDEYFKKIEEIKINNNLQYEFKNLIEKNTIHKNLQNFSNENVSWNFVNNSKNSFNSYDSIECEDCNYCFDVWTIKDSMDVYQTMDYAELHYESHASSKTYHWLFCTTSHENKDIIYTDICFNSENLFWCVLRGIHCSYKIHL